MHLWLLLLQPDLCNLQCRRLLPKPARWGPRLRLPRISVAGSRRLASLDSTHAENCPANFLEVIILPSVPEQPGDARVGLCDEVGRPRGF